MNSEKKYKYTQGISDDWVVFGTFFDGEEEIEDWVANVSTETVAENLVYILNNPVELPKSTLNNFK